MRQANLFIDSKQIAVAYGEDRDIWTTFREEEYSCTEVRFRRVVPVRDMRLKLRDVLMNKVNVVVQMPVEGGQVWKCEVRLTQASWKEDPWGVLLGEFELIGGEPTIESAKPEPPPDLFSGLREAILEGLRRGLSKLTRHDGVT